MKFYQFCAFSLDGGTQMKRKSLNIIPLNVLVAKKVLKNKRKSLWILGFVLRFSL
jgi:hypothetical protein